ncbi:MAG TPA: hypothetical protein VG963_03115 [Polyangiaceae bacterium]|nr:hypothetical protein [Polyangiaceae bacterium]
MRFLALLGCLLPLALAGCGDSDHPPSNAETGGDSPEGGTGSDAAGMPSGDAAQENELADDVLLTLEGKHEVLGGGARLDVKEARQVVLLTVTTVYPNNHDDLILLQLELNGVENAMGQHTENLTSTMDAVAVVQAYIGQVSYTSQSGTLDVTLSNDGKLEGRFSAQLTPDAEDSTDPATLAAQPFDMSGHFAGKWSLICSSPVLALPGDHSTPDSAYCRNLTF